MHLTHHAARLALAGVATLGFTACADEAVTTAPYTQLASFASSSSQGGNGFQFSPLSSSYTCTVAGGDPVNPVSLPAGFAQTILASEPQSRTRST